MWTETDVHRIRGWCIQRNISYGELAFQAYVVYKDEHQEEIRGGQKPLSRRVGIYSFLALLGNRSRRYELVRYINLAQLRIIPLKKVGS